MTRHPIEAGGVEPSLFYTGLVAELYGALRSVSADPEPYARFIARSGEPALELGCGDGEPLLELVRRGFELEGLDSSPDMLRRCREAATATGLDVVLHCEPIESMELSRRFRSVFLAGPTFNLLPDDTVARRALERIRDHLADDGTALIPLFVPPEMPATELGHTREATRADGARMRLTPVSQHHDERRRVQTTQLRYELVTDDARSVLERPWILHWHTQAGFRELAGSVGLETVAVLDDAGAPATDTAATFAFVLRSRPRQRR